MEAAIRSSQNSPANTLDNQHFLYVDVANKHFQLCRITSKYKRRKIEYAPVAISGAKVPAFRAFDWHPVHENLVVVGQTSGEATVLNLQPVGSGAGGESTVSTKPPQTGTSAAAGLVTSLSFNIRSQRPSNAVSLSSSNLLAAGLDRVRTDFCLNIWDFTHRLPSTISAQDEKHSNPFSFTKQSGSTSSSIPEPLHKLAPGEPITSLKFFSSSPSLLVAGVKGQFVRLYDLRDPASSSPSSSHGATSGSFTGSTGGNASVGLQFPTRCVHNLAIDWQDENYFASCFPSGADAMVCLWDRRMHSRSVSTANVGSNYEYRTSEVSLELRNPLDPSKSNSGASIWSLRFAKSVRGCLGVLTSAGHLKVYDVCKDFEEQSETYSVNQAVSQQVPESAESWETQRPQDVYLERAQAISNPFPSQTQDDMLRIVSFDFTTSTAPSQKPEIIALSGTGEVRITSPEALPEPVAMSSTGWFAKGEKHFVQGLPAADEPGETASSGEKLSSLPQPLLEALPELVALTSLARHRCKAGYLLDTAKNLRIVDGDERVRTLWQWIHHAETLNRDGKMVADHFDMSYMGVQSILSADLEAPEAKARTLGQNVSNDAKKKFVKAIETLVRRSNLPANRSVHTSNKLARQLCLYVSDLSWSSQDLEALTSKLVQEGQHAQAAFMALIASEMGLVFKILNGKDVAEKDRMLSIVLAGIVRRSKAKTRPSQSRKGKAEKPESDSDEELVTADDTVWADGISSLLSNASSPYARAILTYARTNDWADVLKEEALPLKYRLCVALRHLDDASLGKYVTRVTKDAVAQGDIEGISLTGIGSKAAFELMERYIAKSGDVQTAVLALAPTIPRYVNEEAVIRKFEAWKQAYRGMMNSWGLRMDRVRFDIAMQKVQVENGTGRKSAKPGKPQVKLVCSYCAGSIAHHDAQDGNADGNGAEMHSTARHPLTPATAAAMGTSCPKCGRKLPRCGVCDMWLGMGDDTYLKWYGKDRKDKTGSGGTVDLSGSTHTIIGSGEKRMAESIMSGGRTMAGSKRGEGSSGSVESRAVKVDVQDAVGESEETQKTKKLDEMMARFTVFCVKCSHGFHAAHARMWFQGSPEEGRDGHKFCPVPRCECICYA
jgi:WD repeat-containing protein mio